MNFLIASSAELTFFLYKAGNFMLDATIRPYVTTAVCRELHGPEAACHSPSYRSRYQDISDTASLYLTYYRIVLYVPAALLGFYWGAWSDQNGRKLPMIVPNVGGVLGVMCYLLMAAFPEKTLHFFLLGTLIQGICCTTTIMKMAVTAYVVENSSKDNVTRRLSILMAMHTLGQLLGSLLSGVLQDLTTIPTTLLVASLFHTLVVLFVVVFIQEVEETKGNVSAFKSGLYGLHQSIEVVILKRPGNSRCLIICLCMATILQSFCFVADLDIPVLYIQGRPLEWPESWYGYYFAIRQAARFVGLLFLQPFLSKYMKISDISMLLSCLVLGLLHAIWLSFSVFSWMMWMSTSLSVLSGINYSIVRSLISEHVDSTELGKIFAFLDCIDVMTRPVGSTMFIAIYSKTRLYFPGMAFIIEGLVYFIFMFLMLFYRSRI